MIFALFAILSPEFQYVVDANWIVDSEVDDKFP